MNSLEQKLEILLQAIKKVAFRTIQSDNEDFDLNDYAGGNIDDAYEIGQNEGEVYFARQLLKAVGEAS